MALSNQEMNEIKRKMQKDQVIQNPVAYIQNSYRVGNASSQVTPSQTSDLQSLVAADTALFFRINYAEAALPEQWKTLFAAQTSTYSGFSGANFKFSGNELYITFSPSATVPIVMYIQQFQAMLNATNTAYYNYVQALYVAQWTAADTGKATYETNLNRSETMAQNPQSSLDGTKLDPSSAPTVIRNQ